MPIICPDCNKSLDKVTICLTMAAKVQEDGAIVIPNMPPHTQMKYLIEEMGDELIICPECDTALWETAAGKLNLFPVHDAMVRFVAERLGKGPKEVGTIQAILEKLPPEDLDFYAAFFGFNN